MLDIQHQTVAIRIDADTSYKAIGKAIDRMARGLISLEVQTAMEMIGTEFSVVSCQSDTSINRQLVADAIADHRRQVVEALRFLLLGRLNIGISRI